MKITYKPFELELKHPFRISKHTRTSTPLILLEISSQGFTGYGEASMVPYMGESVQTATDFLKKVNLDWVNYPFDFAAINNYLDTLASGNPAIKAAVDIALHDLKGKIEDKPCYSFFNSNPAQMPLTSQTIGIDTFEIIKLKVAEAVKCKVLKVKLGSANDKELISAIREVTDKPLYVDANQGWTDRTHALEILWFLKENGVQLVEQPMDKNKIDDNAWITQNSPLPIIADEAVQRHSDIEKIKGAYHGINIKLMKSAGMFEAYKMIERARQLKMKILIGCMSETSIATLAAAALAPLCDWCDLDGPFLTKNNPFKDPDFNEGRYILTDKPGLGLEFNPQ
ncbi:dipeptide epimerase [Rubrolithibacter danxiaensis]|uniref:dipeptide epimerase n=1 Tax=Rubrolithibacter danxiaensis TaxID=3390805 RepID=UPI003BF8A583